MPVNGSTLILLTAASIALLLVLIPVVKLPAFLVGIPIFFEVGVVILAPLVWNLARETKRSMLFYGLPMLAALTVVHSLVPPHPAPAAASQLLGSNLGLTILYGIAVALPMT